MSYHRRRNAERGEQRRLNVDEEYELMAWTERYGVSADRIREAVRAVGNQVSDVVRYLLDGTRSNQLTDR